MVFHVASDPSEIENLVASGGLAKATLVKRKRVGEEFTDYLKTKNANFEEVVEIPPELEPHVMTYFQELRVQKTVDGKTVGEMPMKNTVLDIKSHLKSYILQVTQNRVDISSEAQFPQFARLMKGLLKNLKAVGKGATNHFQACWVTFEFGCLFYFLFLLHTFLAFIRAP